MEVHNALLQPPVRLYSDPWINYRAVHAVAPRGQLHRWGCSLTTSSLCVLGLGGDWHPLAGYVRSCLSAACPSAFPACHIRYAARDEDPRTSQSLNSQGRGRENPVSSFAASMPVFGVCSADQLGAGHYEPKRPLPIS